MNPAHTAETDRIRREVIRLDLYGADAVIAMSLSDLATAYNGCGPDSLPEAARQALDKITSTFSPQLSLQLFLLCGIIILIIN